VRACVCAGAMGRLQPSRLHMVPSTWGAWGKGVAFLLSCQKRGKVLHL
jgi:hypothetical protein